MKHAMKYLVRIFVMVPLALTLYACIDATAPRLPPGEDPGDTTQHDAG